MAINAVSTRGRPRRHPVESFRVRAWYNTIAFHSGIDSPLELERWLEPDHFGRHGLEKKASRNWDKYRDGVRTPRIKPSSKGLPSPVERAAHFIPQSKKVFFHPLWDALTVPLPTVPDLARILAPLSRDVKRFYLDLGALRADPVYFYTTLSDEIGVQAGDHESAIEHLVAIALLFRMSGVVDHQAVYRALSENVVKVIGPIAQSPGIGPFFEELFDWLEDHVWQQKFSCLVDRDGHVYARTSWRQTEDDWLLALV